VDDPGKVIEQMRDEFVRLVTEVAPSGPEPIPWVEAQVLALVTVLLEHLDGLRLLLSAKHEQPALVVLRTFLFGCVRLEWLAAAEDATVREARIVEYQRESVVRETGLLFDVKKTSGDDERIPVMEQRLKDRGAEIHDFKSNAGVAKQSIDEVAIAEKLGRAELSQIFKFLDQFAHINGVATNSVVNEAELDGEIVYAIDRHDQPHLRQTVMSGIALGLSIALSAALHLLGAPEGLLSKTREIGQKWQLNTIPQGPMRDEYEAELRRRATRDGESAPESV
jgi:hypothetical protein